MTDSSHGYHVDGPPLAAPHGAPANKPAGGRSSLYATIGTGIVFAGALTYTGLVDPHRQGSLFPQCAFKLLTGWECPACGGLRMTHDLLHGDFAAAVVDNVYLLVAIPLLALWFVLRRVQKRSVMPLPLLAILAVSAVAWMVVRNLPGFPLVPTILGG